MSAYIYPEPSDEQLAAYELSTHRLYEISMMLETRGWDSHNDAWDIVFRKQYEGCGSVAYIIIKNTGDVSIVSRSPEDPTDELASTNEPVGLEDFIYDALDIIRIWQRGQIIPDWGGK